MKKGFFYWKLVGFSSCRLFSLTCLKIIIIHLNYNKNFSNFHPLFVPVHSFVTQIPSSLHYQTPIEMYIIPNLHIIMKKMHHALRTRINLKRKTCPNQADWCRMSAFLNPKRTTLSLSGTRAAYERTQALYLRYDSRETVMRSAVCYPLPSPPEKTRIYS